MFTSWSGERWFEYFHGKRGGHAWAVGLGHRTADSSGGVIVSASRRRTYDLNFARGGIHPLIEIAFDGAIRLANATLPTSGVPQPPGLSEALVEHMRHQSEHYQHWPVAHWKIDGSLTTNPILIFAAGWMTFTDAVSDVYLTMIGIDTPCSPSLNVVEVTDLREYGFGSNARLPLSSLAETDNPRVEDRLPQRKYLHSDYLALM